MNELFKPGGGFRNIARTFHSSLSLSSHVCVAVAVAVFVSAVVVVFAGDSSTV